MSDTPTIENKKAHLENILREIGGPLIVAFSGGVDSSVVAKFATMTLGRDKVRCIAARSESNTEDDIELCRSIATDHDLEFEVVEYSELAIPNYAENPANRCYFCKSELYGRLDALAEGRDVVAVLDGSNADDGGDYRPGLKAVKEKGVRSPLREAGLTKADVRELARQIGLPNHDKPSSPCLSSRIPYGQKITREKLDQVGRAEKFLRSIGLREFRCRHHETVARLEVLPDDFPLVVEKREEIIDAMRKIGFTWVALDLAGFKSGSLNSVLPAKTIAANTSAPDTVKN